MIEYYNLGNKEEPITIPQQLVQPLIQHLCKVI